jgi:hypothetical protein
MAHRSRQFVNLAISVDTGMLTLAKHRALLERTSVNRYLANQLEDYADGALDAARRTKTAAYVYGVVEEVRRLRRKERARRRTESFVLVQSPSEADLTPYQASDRDHDSTTARGHESRTEG